MSLMSIGFVLFFLIGSAMSFVRHPIYGLMVYMGVFYLNPPERWWGQGALLGMRWSLLSAAIVQFSALFAKRREFAVKSDRGIIVGFVLMIIWLFIQSFWALAPDYHSELIEYWIKFLIVLVLIPRVIEDESHLRIFLWTHVVGCF